MILPAAAPVQHWKASMRRARTVAAWCLLVGSIIGWPLTALTVFRDEPQGILGLSWLAIVLTSLDLLSTSQVHQEQGAK